MNQADTEIIRKRLMLMAEERYRVFTIKLLCYEGKYVSKWNVLGVRLPALRTIAKELAKEDWKRYTSCADDAYFEEVMLWALILGYAKGAEEELLEQIALFLPYIDCWSICDTFAGGLKWIRADRERAWDFLQPYIDSGLTYSIRFAVVMLLGHFTVQEYIDRVLERLLSIKHPDYYVKTAVAWALCECYVKFPKETDPYLNKQYLDNDTYRMTLQKIIESYRIDDAVRQEMRLRKKK